MHDIQRKILQVAHTRNLGDLSLRKLGEIIGAKYPNQVRHHLLSLLDGGFLQKEATGNISLGKRMETRNTLSLISIPIMGSASCGEALMVADDVAEGYLRVSTKLVPSIKNAFAVRASGNSMNLAKINGSTPIHDGDYVIVDASDRVARNGDYIVGIIDGLANIKLFSHDKKTGHIALVSESTEDNPPIFLHEDDKERFLVAGKVKSVLRNPKSSK
jgi:SOS-response transcriptional repressor LexA